MLNKKECINAFNYIKRDCEVYSESNQSEMEYALCIVKETLDTYFDKVKELEKAKEIYQKLCNDINPPLKYEELEEGMWVWDNKVKAYYHITFNDEINEWCYYHLFTCVLPFEKDRFYRKQVE